jgi:hypothetical protein
MVMDKAQIKRNYKQTPTPMGIYQIKNLVSGKVLIGSSKNLPGKLNGHRFQLELGSHINKGLQKDFSELGKENFAFEALDYLEPKSDPAYDYAEDLKELERLWRVKLLQSHQQFY